MCIYIYIYIYTYMCLRRIRDESVMNPYCCGSAKSRGPRKQTKL